MRTGDEKVVGEDDAALDLLVEVDLGQLGVVFSAQLSDFVVAKQEQVLKAVHQQEVLEFYVGRGVPKSNL